MTAEKEAADLLEKAASLLANAHKVEEAWFLRGIAEGLADNYEETDETYGNYQIRGRRALETMY